MPPFLLQQEAILKPRLGRRCCVSPLSARLRQFPKSRVLTPDVTVGQPGQVARFEYSKETKKGKHHHGRRADVIFVA